MEPNDDIQFDRLVDDELSDTERRQLLTSLDDRPDGWRKCALAFLEAQAWRREMGRLTEEPAAPAPATPVGRVDSPIASRRAVQFLTLAASVFVAFTLGLAFGDLPHPHHAATPSPSNNQLASTPSTPDIPVRPAAQPTDALTLWARDASGQVRPLRVPLVDAAALDRRLGLEFQSGLPPEVLQQLKARGYQVESKRRYAPFLLDNGRPLVVPVEDTKIVPVSSRVY